MGPGDQAIVTIDSVDRNGNPCVGSICFAGENRKLLTPYPEHTEWIGKTADKVPDWTLAAVTADGWEYPRNRMFKDGRCYFADFLDGRWMPGRESNYHPFNLTICHIIKLGELRKMTAAEVLAEFGVEVVDE